jgi:hypothetical protein
MLSALSFRYKGNTDKQMVQLNFYNSQGIYICIFSVSYTHIQRQQQKTYTYVVNRSNTYIQYI